MSWLVIKTAEDRAAEARQQLRDQLKARRDRAIAAGTTVGGMPVQTDDLSQQRIVGAALAVTVDPASTVRWKLADGTFMVLDASVVIAIATAVRTHVQGCFDREAELLADIETGGNPDIDAGWPVSDMPEGGAP